MPEKTKHDLALYRIEKAKECLENAEFSLEHSNYIVAINRSYYCILHAMRAVLALDGFDSQKHSGIISAFRQRYIKTELFPQLFPMLLERLLNLEAKAITMIFSLYLRMM